MDFQNQLQNTLQNRLQQSAGLTEEQAYQKCINDVYDSIKQHILQAASRSNGNSVLSGELPLSTSIGYTEDRFQKPESNLYYVKNGSDPYLYLREPCKLIIKHGFAGAKASISLTSAGRRYMQDLDRLSRADKITLTYKPLYRSTYSKKTLTAFDVSEKVESTHLASATLLICWQVTV